MSQETEDRIAFEGFSRDRGVTDFSVMGNDEYRDQRLQRQWVLWQESSSTGYSLSPIDEATWAIFNSAGAIYAEGLQASNARELLTQEMVDQGWFAVSVAGVAPDAEATVAAATAGTSGLTQIARLRRELMYVMTWSPTMDTYMDTSAIYWKREDVERVINDIEPEDQQ